jgi:hypothetical protein
MIAPTLILVVHFLLLNCQMNPNYVSNFPK